jgi:type I restriction enzyme, S subunit
VKMNINNGWKSVPLGEICDVVIGKTPARQTPKYWGGENQWLSISDMSQGKFISKTKEKITDAGVKECGCRLIEKGTLLLSFKLSIGKVGFAEIPLYTNEAIAALPIKRRDLITEGYLYWVLQHIDLERYVDKAAKGKTLNKAKLKDMNIPFPSLDEQERIVAVLDMISTLINKRRQSIVHINGLPQSIFLEMFGDPVNNPKGWPEKRLSELGTLERGRSKHRPRNAPELLGGDYPLIQTGDVSSASGYIRKFSQTYSEVGLKQSKMWKAGTLCITIAANIAKTAILTFDACFPDSVVGFIPSEETTTEYIQYWMSFRQKELEEKAPEFAQKNINLKILSELNVPVPPKTLQDKFSIIVSKIEELNIRLKDAAAVTEELFRALQNSAFTGKLYTKNSDFVPYSTEAVTHV